MNKKKLAWQLPFLSILIIGTIIILKKQAPFRTDEGFVFGTVYKITYQSEDNLKEEIETELKKVDNLRSYMLPTSIYRQEKIQSISYHQNKIKAIDEASMMSNNHFLA